MEITVDINIGQVKDVLPQIPEDFFKEFFEKSQEQLMDQSV